MRPLSRYGPLRHRISSYIRSPTNAIAHYNGSHVLAPLNSCSSSRASHILIFPEPPSTEHHDLASYAAYAARTGLDVTSKTYVGTAYEYTVAAALARLNFTVRRVGGRADCGIDLLGLWRVPSSPIPVRVLAQCKASSAQSTRVGPHLVRELEGAFAGAPAGWRGATGVLGLLVAQKPATRGVRDALGRSRWPMGYVSCSRDGRLEQMLWNERARQEGLEGLGATVQFAEDGDGSQEKRLVLTWKGRPVVSHEPSQL
ncbi:hypothetical protein F4821DRAFT_98280 [Hypoxylon rubiginosum]|uniref:Uncharacterized protein n=1 Tax=Hypoxylon rubiginosum TaxID=110542 RepID=A0ACC0D5R8_9PEZI|nr:hypothetical protein F4821DRAFT_98280 [Hypoxylon rubiginosum]